MHLLDICTFWKIQNQLRMDFCTDKTQVLV